MTTLLSCHLFQVLVPYHSTVHCLQLQTLRGEVIDLCRLGSRSLNYCDQRSEIIRIETDL